MCKHCYVVRRGKSRYVYCKLTPKHKQRQGYHTMAHRSGEFCLVCNVGMEVERQLSSVATTELTVGGNMGVSMLTQNFSSLGLMRGASGVERKPDSAIKIAYNPSVGIFSVLNMGTKLN